MEYPIQLTLDLNDIEYIVAKLRHDDLSKLEQDITKDKDLLDKILMQVYD